MASPILVTLKLDPFYQRFLRSYYNCEEPVMEFPCREDFNILLAHLVGKTPKIKSGEKLEKKDFGEYTFIVALPYIEHKDVFYYNHFSERSLQIFQTKVYDFFKMIFHGDLNHSVHNLGIPKNDAIRLFMEKYNLLVDDEDRIKKGYYRYEKRLLTEFYRWNQKKRVQKHRKYKKIASSR